MMTSRESTVTTVTRVDCVSQDSSRNDVLHVLRQLDTLLLGPEDEDNEAKDVELQRQMEPSIPSTEQQGPPYIRQPASQHQLLQQLLKNALENPESAVAAFNPDIGHLNAYQLLLSSLQDGHLAAAQTLLLLQLMHQASMQPQQSCSHGRTKPADTAACNECTGASSAVIAAGSSSDGNDSAIASRTVVWPDFVFRRLVDMILATQQVPSETAAAAAALPVVALRLLATAAATAAASSAPGQVPAALTTAVQQIMTEAATAAESSSAAIHSPAHSTVIPSCWLSDLGLSGLITLSDLISSWTIAAAAAGAGSNSTIIAAAASLQLQLLQYIHHPTTAAAAATSDMDVCVAGISTAASSSSINCCCYSSSSQKVEKCSSPDRYAIQCPLVLLVHQNDNTVVQAQSVHAASGGGKVTAAGSSSSSSSKTTGSSRPVMAACCAAAITVISNVTVMVLRLQEYKITMDKQVIKDVAEFVKSLIASSPMKAAQEFNWSGKPTGYALKQTAAETCRCSITATATAANDASDTPYHCFNSWSCHNRLCYNKWLNTLLPQATSSNSNSNSSSSLGVTEAAQYPQTILEAAVLLLLAVTSCGGRTAAAELYRYDVSSMLEKLREFSNPRVLDLTEKVYGRLCLLSSQIKDEIMQDGNILALTGVMKCAFALWEPAAAAGVAEKSCSSSSRQRLLLAALSRLSAAVDAAGGSHILRFTGSLGTSAPAPVPALLAAAAAASTVRATAAQHAASSSPSSKSSSSVLGTVVDSATCVLHSSSCGLAALLLLLLLEVQSQPGGGGGGLSQQLRAAAAQLFVAVLNRCRSMQHLQQHQVPRGGLWSQLGVTAVKQVEIIAMNPNSSSSSDSACQETGNEQKVETAAARAMEAGGSVKPGAKAGKAEAAEAAAAQVEDRAYDEDGLRVVWSSGPSAATVAARTAWKQYSLHQLLTWSQSSTDLDVRLLLPQGTNKQDVIVSLQPDRITVRLSWYGRVVDGPLAGRIKTSEACWILDKAIARMKPGATAMPLASGAAAGGGSAAAAVDEEFSELQLLLPKENAGHFWRALFEGGVEKSHLEVLQEAITNEDDARCCPSIDQLGPEAALLYEELRERQELMVSGHWDIENSFDDFRLVIGDHTL